MRVTTWNERGGATPLIAAEPVLIYHRAARIEGQIGDRPVGQAGEVDRRVHARELRVVERVEHVGADLEPDAFDDAEVLREREIHVVDRRRSDEEPCRFGAVAARLRRCEARRVELLVWVAAPAATRVAREHDARVGIAVSTREVGGTDVRDVEVHGVRPAARPSIDTGDLPVVRDDAERTAGELRYLVDEVDDEVVRAVVVQVTSSRACRVSSSLRFGTPAEKSVLLMPRALLQT